MKRMKLLSLGIGVSLLAAVGIGSAALATWSPNFVASGDSAVVAKEATHQGSLYVAGEEIVIDGTVTGTVYCAGSTVTINGSVEGDVLCAAQKIVINGTVAQDVRVAGQYVDINGTVDGSLSAFGQDIRLASESTIGDDINGAGQQVNLGGTVGRDVVLGVQSLTVGGQIQGNVDVAVERLHLREEARIAGNLNYSASKELSVDPAKVQGAVSFNLVEDNKQSGQRFASGLKVIFLIMLAASAIVVALVLPRFLNRSSELYSRDTLVTSLLGFAFVFGGPIIVALLCMTVVLAPIGLALLFGWLAVIFLSGVFFAYWVGAELLRSQTNIIIRMLGGVAIVLVAYTIPVLSVIVMLVATVVGSGMIVKTLTDGYRRPNYQVAAVKKPTSKAK